MRRAILFSCGVLTLSFSLVTGCEGPSLTSQQPGVAADPQADALAQQAAEQAQRINGASSRQAQSQQQRDTYQPREIIWRDNNMANEPSANTTLQPTQTTDQANTQPAPTAPPASPVAETQPDTQHELTPRTTPAPPRTASLSYNQACQQLIQSIKASDDSNLDKAITAATIGAISTHGELDWSLLEPLSPQDRDRVQRYHKAVAALRDQALATDGVIDRDTLSGKLGEVFGDQPIEIRSIKLCEKVQGYGVYDAFPENKFPAGRDQKLIVYVELDHFKPEINDTGEGYKVSLKQELELYESSGFEVWSHEPVEIVDVSRNQRRDFFVVQMVTLPGKLALGQYRLKVRIIDENGGTRDETSIPITITADDTLVSRQKPN